MQLSKQKKDKHKRLGATELSSSQQLRYSAQLLLPEINEQQQLDLLSQSVLIVGLGGLGSLVASYLAGAGVGHLLLADDDRVSLSNLPRQLLYTTAQIGKLKVACAKARLGAQNPDVQVTCLASRLSLPDLLALVPKVNLVLDCTDNTQSRLAINQACSLQQVPFISGAATGWQGQLLALKPWLGQGCYQCLYPDWPESPSCFTSGILGPMVGAIGCQQALLALKVLLQIDGVAFGAVQCVDGFASHTQQFKLQQDPACPICGPHQKR